MINTLIKTTTLINKKIALVTSWLTLVMVVITFLIVLLRYVFDFGWVWMQELVTYCHAIVFLGVAGFTLGRNGHVRVDIIYQKLSLRRKVILDSLGVLFFLWPVCLLIFSTAWPYVYDSWAVLEKSGESGGLGGVFILKSFILVYSALLFLQGLSTLLTGFNRDDPERFIFTKFDAHKAGKK